MDEGFRWAFKIVNEMSGPSKEMSKDTKELKGALKDVGVEIKKTEEEAKSAGGALKELGQGFLKAFAVGELIETPMEFIGSKIGELVHKVAEIGIEFGKDAIAAADFEDRSQIAFETLLGSASRAKDIIEEAKSFAFKSAQPLNEVLTDYQNLLLAKVKPIDIPVVLQGATDLAALSGGRVPLQELVQQFSRIGSQGQLAGRALTTLAQAGLNVEGLAKRLGFQDFLGLQRGLNTSPVDAARGLKAILQTIAEQEGGTLGKATLRMADTVGGSIQKIKTGWESMLGSISTAPEFEGFRASLAGIAELFDINSDRGKLFADRLNEILTKGLGIVDDFLGNKDAVADFFDTGLELAKDLLAVMQDIEKVAKVLYSPIKFQLDILHGENPFSGDINSSTALADRAGIRPKLAGGGYADTPTDVTIGDGGEGEFVLPESKLARLMAGGGGNQATIDFGGVHVTPKPGDDSQELAQRVREIVASALESALEGYQIEMGSSE